MSSTPILAFPDVKEPFILYTDASLTAMGAVLAQVQDGKERAICYASKAFSKSQTNYSATKRELLAIVTFTRHFKYYLLGRKFKIVTDHRALQWLHNFKDPDGLTARWLEKLAAFDYEVQHRPGKSIGHADGLSRIPIVNQVTTSQSKENIGKPVKTKCFELIHKTGNLFDSKDSLAHCISSDFKMSAGIARSFKRKFPYIFPDNTNTPLFVQQVDNRFIYHLVMKKRFFQKPTYDSLRKSLEAMTNHANKHKVTQISMPKVGCGLDRLEWHKVECLIKEICAQSNLTITVYDQSKDEQSQKQIEAPVRSALGQAQRQDEALSKLIQWIEKGKVPTSQELQGLPRLAWQLNNQLTSLQLLDGILCRKFETSDNEVVLQQKVPPSMTHEILSACHSSSTAGHLGVAKTSEKTKQRFYWPGLQEDTKLYVSRCPECQKRSGPPKKYHRSLVEWQASYPFHHIGIDFMGPLPLSNGNKHILVIGDHFTKWYETIPLPDQTATTTANALVDHWISRFGCPHSLHSDQGRNFESRLFEQLMQLLELDKTRTTPFHPQSNAVIERMNKTLQNMLAKCINEEQSIWSQQLPYVMMAYRSSVHESTGYTPQFLDFGQELSLPLHCMYPKPQENNTSDIHEIVHNKQQAFQRAFELIRRKLNTKQKRRNAIYNKKVHGPTYKEGQKVLLYHPAIAVGTTSKFASPWKSPYNIEKCLNDVTFRIKEENTTKQQIVHYDRLKPFFEPPPTSNVPTRNKP